MQINNIALSTDKCKKPCGFLSFEADNNSMKEKKKVRYKHYEELSDDVLSVRSIIKAHQDAQKSKKMHLYKAIPLITTGIIATSLTITRPGKLSAKAATGLGFLATMAGIRALYDTVFSSDNTKRKQGFATLGALGAIAAGSDKMKNTNGFSKGAEFIKKEATQLAQEINDSTLSCISDKYVEPFIKKHKKIAFLAPAITAVTSSILGGLASVGLIKGISKDISKNAADNYERAKAIQQIAREHFNSVDAIEV